MTLAVLVTAGLLMRIYFRARAVSVAEAAAVGALWLAMGVVLDYPMFAFGPMKITLAARLAPPVRPACVNNGLSSGSR